MPVPFEFDFRNPDYSKVWEHRTKMLLTIRENPECLDGLHAYYKNHIPQFINDWGITYDPRNADVGLPTRLPFILFDKQEECIEWILDCWRNRKKALIEKSRDMGLSWISIAVSCVICLYHQGVSIGFGSRLEEYVDQIGNPKSIFEKGRMFMEALPPEFRGGFNRKQHAPHMRMMFPNGSTITGEGGDNIGRGDRKTLYFVDEAAHLQRPMLIEAALSATTNCRIDLSSIRGMDNPFAQKRHSGKFEVFTFHWRNDPRKDEIWYEKTKEEINNPVILAQEYDINYSASVEGIVIPNEWAQAAVDAHIKLKIEPTGSIDAALDVADQGVDLNAMAVKKGILLFYLKSWSGKGSDTLYTTEEAFKICDDTDCNSFQYDADGLGAFVRGDSRMINERRESKSESVIQVVPFRGSGEVIFPDRETIKGRKNKDYFLNRKAQSWWMLRLRFQQTFRAINGGEFDPEEIISIDSKLPLLQKLLMELSQPSYTITTAGKIQIDKAPDGSKSPNLADAVMMDYSPARRTSSLF